MKKDDMNGILRTSMRAAPLKRPQMDERGVRCVSRGTLVISYTNVAWGEDSGDSKHEDACGLFKLCKGGRAEIRKAMRNQCGHHVRASGKPSEVSRRPSNIPDTQRE